MPELEAEYFTDPLSPWCWGVQPGLRRLQFEFEDLTLVPRMTLLLPDTAREELLPDGVSPEELGPRFAEEVGTSGMPVAPDLWAAEAPTSSWPACAAVAYVRDRSPGRVGPFLYRVREAAFAQGAVVDTPATLRALASEVGGIDGEELAGALDDGRAADALATDLDRARSAARELDAGAEARGDVGRLLASPRRPTGEVPLPDEPADEPEDVEASPETRVAPPAIWFHLEGGAVFADPRIGYGRLATIGGRAIPAQVEGLSDKYGTGRLSMHIPQDVAESLSSREFLPQVEAFVTRFERVYLAELTAGTGLSPATCRGCLETLTERGVVQPLDAAGTGWRIIDGVGPSS